MNRGAHSGFTILECLVATTVSGILCGLLCWILNGALSCWADGRSLVEVNRQAGVALAVMANDLRNAVVFSKTSPDAGADQWRENTVFWMLAPMEARKGLPGDLAIIEYHLQWKESDSVSSAGFHLYRSVLPPPSALPFLKGEAFESGEPELLASHVVHCDLQRMDDPSVGTVHALDDGRTAMTIQLELSMLSSQFVRAFESSDAWKTAEIRAKAIPYSLCVAVEAREKE